MITKGLSSRAGPWFVFLSLVAAGCAPSPAPTLTEAQARGIRDTVTALENTMNLAVDALDCTTGLGYIGDQQPVFVSNARVVRTKPALQTLCESMVAPRTGAIFATDTLSAHALSPDAAYLVREGNYTINYKDGRAETQRLIMTTVWARENGEWKMVHLHESFARLAP
jgi:ketosteroid isomerase-like protein